MYFVYLVSVGQDGSYYFNTVVSGSCSRLETRKGDLVTDHLKRVVNFDSDHSLVNKPKPQKLKIF